MPLMPLICYAAIRCYERRFLRAMLPLFSITPYAIDADAFRVFVFAAAYYLPLIRLLLRFDAFYFADVFAPRDFTPPPLVTHCRQPPIRHCR